MAVSGRDFVLSKRVACPRIAGMLRVGLGEYRYSGYLDKQGGIMKLLTVKLTEDAIREIIRALDTVEEYESITRARYVNDLADLLSGFVQDEPDSGLSNWQTASESLYRARVYLSQYPETQWGIENGIGPAIMILFHCECALRLEHSQE